MPVTQRPTQVAAVYSSCFSEAIRAAALRWRPDVIQLEGDTIAYCGRRLEGLPAARVLDCDDPGLEASKDLAARTGGRQRLAHRLDVLSWQRYWLRTLPKLDSIVALTETDQQAFRRVIADAPVVRIPLGIELPERPLSPTGSGEPSVIFVGSYNHHPNAEAALRLTRSIMPIARRRLPRLRLVLVGDGVTDELRAAVGPQDVIEVSVPDVAPYVDEAALMALPIRMGGGMRVKLLEALAAGKAVVASARAASGLDVRDGRELMLAETDEEFAEAVVRLASDAEARLRLANNAREWALCNLGWESRVDEYERLYRSLLTDGR
jgi:glycosyltransferase involved in cell wall biosynthesis